jgi:hypothetical protein
VEERCSQDSTQFIHSLVSRAEAGVQLTVDGLGNTIYGVISSIASSLSLTSFGCRNDE